MAGRVDSGASGFGLLNGVTEHSGVVTNAAITRDHDHEGRYLAHDCRSRQMDGVQSTDGFHRKRSPGMCKNRVSKAHDITTAGKPLEREQRCSLLLYVDPSREVSAKHCAACFGNGYTDVIRCPDARIEAFAEASHSSKAATKALDSMYRIAGTSEIAIVWPETRAPRGGADLRFATITINQICCRTAWEPNLRAAFQRVTVFGGRRDRASDREPFELAPLISVGDSGGNKFRDNPSVSSDHDTLPRLD